jgi:hypothetical protein
VFFVANILILAIKLPTLKKKDADEETETEVENE